MSTYKIRSFWSHTDLVFFFSEAIQKYDVIWRGKYKWWTASRTVEDININNCKCMWLLSNSYKLGSLQSQKIRDRTTLLV